MNIDSSTLSHSQHAAANAFAAFLLDSTKHSMVIAGFAGSGKSYLVRYLKQLANQMNQVQKIFSNGELPFVLYYTATTNKAIQVLRDLVNEPTCTIHSLLGLKVKNNFNTGKTNLTPTHKTHQIRNAVIFVDEASMVDQELLSFIRTYTKDSKVVFIGDSYQLPPVFEKESPVFKNKNVVYLKEIQRQVAGNPIIKASMLFRGILDQGPPFVWPEYLEGIEPLSGPEFRDLVEDRFTQDHDPDDYKILAYTNAQVVAYNKHVRSLYTAEPDFIVGEHVLLNSPAMVGDSVALPSDTVVKITNIKPAKELDIEGFEVELDEKISGFHPKDFSQVTGLLKHYAKHKDWGNYFAIKEGCLDIRSVHALTIHKSQGSTYKEVFIDLNDISKNNKWYEVARLMYVALTRASDKVYLYGKLANRWENASKR